MSVILQNSPVDEPVYTYLDKKRSEGKPYKVYMIAAANKFLRIYYARTMLALSTPEVTKWVYKKFGITILNFLYVDNTPPV